jgi:hypothetical protein
VIGRGFQEREEILFLSSTLPFKMLYNIMIHFPMGR